MKIIINNKKILAREFVYFIICLLIFSLTFLFIFPYNYFTQNQAANFSKKVKEKNVFIDSIKSINNKKIDAQNYFTDNYKKEFDIDIYSEVNTELWNTLNRIVKADSVKYKWENKWENDHCGHRGNSASRFRRFYRRSSLNCAPTLCAF